MPDAPTPKHAIEQPADGDFINQWPAIMRTALGQLDTLLAAFVEDDPRPAAGVSGRFHRAADGTISFDTGAAWVEVARMGHGARHAELGDDPMPGQLPIGGIIPYAGQALPPGGAFAWADGSLIDRIDGNGNPTEFFNRVGHAYNGGVDPGANKVRLPDKRGRVSVGADSYGQGAAGRLPNSNHGRGQSGGEERHTLAAAESGVNGSGSTTTFAEHQVQINSPAGGIGGLTAYEGNGHQFDTYANHSHGLNARTADSPHNNMQPYEADNYIVRIA